MAARKGFQPGGDIFLDGGDSGRFIEDDIAIAVMGINVGQFFKVQATDPTEPSGFATWVNNDGSDVGRPATATGDSVVIKQWSVSTQEDAMPAPVFVSISPAIGDVLGGTPVVVTVADAVNINTVKLGGVPLTGLTITSATTLSGVTGPHAAGVTGIEVVSAGGSDTEPNVFTYVVAPAVLSVSPNTGDEAGGTVVTAEVPDSSLVTSLYFGTLIGTAFTVVDATHVRATTPAQAPGLYDVSANAPYAVNRLQNGYAYRFSVSFSPVHLWRLDETAGLQALPSFGGLTGTHGNTALVGQVGKISRSVKYNNTGATALGSKTNFGQNLRRERNKPFSVSAWIAYTGSSGPIICAMQPASPFRGWLFNSYTSGFGLHIINTNGSNYLEVVANVAALTNGQFHHVVATYDGTSLAAGVQLYYDGVAQAKVVNGNSLSATAVYDAAELLIAGRGNNVVVDYGPMPGNVDDVALFDGVLTAADVAKLYARGNAGASAFFAAGAAGAYSGISPNHCSTVGASSAITVSVTTTSGITDIKLGGVSMTGLTVVDETTITGFPGAHAAGTVDCVVYYANGTTSTGAVVFTYVQSTAVTNVSPNEGDEAGNTLVTLTVGNSALVASIYFGGALATNVVVVDSTHVQCRTPARTPQDAAVSVNTDNAAEGNTFTFTFDITARPTNVWQFNENLTGTPVADTGSAADTPGTYGTWNLVGQTGKIGRAPILNGVGATALNAAILFGDKMSFERTQAWSACGWMKSTAAACFLMGRMQPGAPYIGWDVEVTAAGNLDVYLINDFFANLFFQKRAAVPALVSNVWKHWAVTYNGNGLATGVTIYVDGAAVAMTTPRDTLGANTIIRAANRFSMGSRSDGSAADVGPMNGQLDDAAFFLGTVLSAADIAKIYAEGNAGASVRYAR